MLKKMVEMLFGNEIADVLDESVVDEPIREIMLADADIFGLERKEEIHPDDYLRIVYFERTTDGRTDVYLPNGLNPGSLTLVGSRLNRNGNNHNGTNNGNSNGGYQR